MPYKNPIPSVDDEKTSENFFLLFKYDEPKTQDEAVEGINNLIKENAGQVPAEWVQMGYPKSMRYAEEQPHKFGIIKTSLINGNFKKVENMPCLFSDKNHAKQTLEKELASICEKFNQITLCNDETNPHSHEKSYDWYIDDSMNYDYVICNGNQVIYGYTICEFKI